MVLYFYTCSHAAFRKSAAKRLAFPDPVGGFTAALAKFLGVFALTQIPLAVAEGFLGLLAFRLLGDVAPAHMARLGLLRRPASSSSAVPAGATR